MHSVSYLLLPTSFDHPFSLVVTHKNSVCLNLRGVFYFCVFPSPSPSPNEDGGGGKGEEEAEIALQDSFITSTLLYFY